jgi:serine/threonine protein kinase
MRPLPLEEPEDSQRLLAGRYRLDRQIARGGMAEVWLGTDTFLDRPVAIKVLKPQLANDPVIAERFRREALACAGLNHANIVAVYDSVEDKGRQAVVMQYIEGKSLRELLDRRKRLGALVTIHMGIAMASALDFAHRAGLVHRDVKPGNILVTPQGRFLLADFGIAKALSTAGEDLTDDNVMMGTAKYLSPEQVRGKPLDGRADLYGLGLVMYECLAGKVPFIGETDADTALARLQREPTDLSQLRSSLAPELVHVIHKLMARNPEHRYLTGQETSEALTKAIEAQNNYVTSMTPPSGVKSQTPINQSFMHKESLISQISELPVEGQAEDRFEDQVEDFIQVPDKQRRSKNKVDKKQKNEMKINEKMILKETKKRNKRSKSSGGRIPTSTKILGLIAILLSIAVMYVATQGFDPSLFTSRISSTQANSGVAPVIISRVVSYDPNGQDGLENEAGVWALTDNDQKTTWSTDCYATAFFGDKKYVGALIELSQPASGVLKVGMQNGPWSLEIYTATGVAPTSLEQWGEPTATDYNTRRGVAQFMVPSQTQFVLLMMREIGMSDQCSPDNPYQGLMQDLTFNAA